MEVLITPITLDYFTQRTLTGKSGREFQWHELVATQIPPRDVLRDQMRDTYAQGIRQRVQAYIQDQLVVAEMVNLAVVQRPQSNPKCIIGSMAEKDKRPPETQWTDQVAAGVKHQLDRQAKPTACAVDTAMEGEL